MMAARPRIPENGYAIVTNRHLVTVSNYALAIVVAYVYIQYVHVVYTVYTVTHNMYLCTYVNMYAWREKERGYFLRYCPLFLKPSTSEF